VEFVQPAEEVLLTDEAEIARAKAGPDIHCPYCEARNPGSAKFCGECGGDLSEGIVREHGKVVGAHRDKPAPDILCPSCGTPHPATAQRCTNCGASLTIEESETPAPIPRQAVPSKRRAGISGMAIVFGLLCVGIAAVAIYFLTRTEQLIGSVQSVQWTRTIPILAQGPVEHEDWLEDIPNDAVVGACQLEYHHTQDEPAPNAQEVCGTPYTVDTGSGFGEVVQDCFYEVYEERCTYTQMEWVTVDSVTVTGNDLNPSWPATTLSEGQMEGEGEEIYEIVFQTDEGSYTYTTSDAAQFSQFTPGTQWSLTINALKAVVSVEPRN
jgi:hypothetical protein